MAQLVTIYTSLSLSEIYIAQARLEEAGILSFTKDERLHQTAPYLSYGSNGIQLQVTIDEVDQAVQVLQDADILIPAVEKKDNFSKKLKWIFVLVLLIELLYLLHKNKVI
ncbi:Putative signal transducing protein [Arachidicoccus rhizosphaerae]|uniref:Putative signal transducing protein n=1 Tax=Arachidicoccus rhizosphaerae TaxID=551991 RepID=A0A1H3WJA9_9BACT|nr:DUF2007 domain-containing protein [Arachidicoccus rhizosphaerae]SDZ86412.1 Putative signal transducing protein [Arachidicoccus rhizosphaerae]